MIRKTVLTIAFLCSFSVVAAAQLTQTTITGTLYLPTGAVAPNVRITLVKSQVTGQGMAIINQTYLTNASGVYSFNAPKNSTIWVYANVIGLNTNGSAGVALTVGSASSYDLKDLITVPTVPSTGLTAKDEGTALTSLIGTMN